MPRNAAKKTNKNAKKRLPVLIKLTNININNNKKKKVNSNKNKSNNSSSNNNKSRINNNNNTTAINEIKYKKKRKIIETKKVIVNATFTTKSNTTNQIDNCDANSIKTTPVIRKNSQESTADSTKTFQTQQESILKYFAKSLQNFNEEKIKEATALNIENIIKNENNFNICKIASCEDLISKTELDISTELVITPLPSANTSLSSLYPIVIETSESFQHDDKDKEQQQQKQQKHSLVEENNLNSKKKKLHSICNCSKYNNNNINTCCHTAVDTLKQHKSQNNTNNTTITTTAKRNNNKQKPSVATSSETLTNQSQEVKARLATLRTRKKVLTQQQQEQKGQKIGSGLAVTAGALGSSPSSEPTTEKANESSEEKDFNRPQLGKYLIKKVSPVLDDATLNLIETLSEEVKKPNNKRKRNNTQAILLGLATLHQPRPKRIAANPTTQTPAVAGVQTSTNAVVDNNNSNRNEQKNTTAGNFLKPLPIEATNTNSKKRARIMSLYERPFQATNDGRGGGGGGSVVGNGYMTSSRSSASSGGAMVMNDTGDTQEMANQYYLSGSSGSVIAGNSNPSLVGNGSAINHAPTMGTLCNIGNTCYLNSVVYTLRFAPQFLHNLHHLLADLNALQQNIARARSKSSSLGRGISAVHMENARSWSSKDLASMEQYNSGSGTAVPSSGTNNSSALTQVTQKSCHQLLTEKLHELYQSLHRNEINESTEPHHADTLLHAIQDVSSIFEGNQQQDAHEFLMCLLNSIRETSQTLIKAIAECPDVILNGYISNPDEVERDLMKNHTTVAGSGVGSGVAVGTSNSNNSNSLASASSKTSSFFSRKSKRKDESKNSKNSRLQSPLKDALMSGGNTQITSTSNSLFYLNTNDLNTASTSTAASASAGASSIGGGSNSLTSPSNSTALVAGSAVALDETDAPTAVALILKDKQRLEGKIRELGLDFFNEDFEGITVSTTKCLSCETITEQKETMIDIAVPVPQAGYESNEFMDRPSSFIQNSCITREYFRNENKYRCEQCCGYTEAIRSISYEVLPRLLIIQLSRFSGGMEKINSYIPTSFTLQCFCSKCCELSDANKLHIYKLYSVITHVGATMSVGHYIAYTCSLDWANEYINCPKEQRRRASQERNLGAAAGNSTSTANSSQSSATSSGLGSSSTGFMKMKMKFGRSKASSSGDMSKNVKQLNGLNSSSKAITNGLGKLSMNNSGAAGVGGAATPQCPVTCQSINCCAMRLSAQQQLQYQSANNSTSDFSEESSQYSNGSGYNTPANYNNNIHHNYTTSANTSGYGSTGRGSTKASYATTQNNCSEPIWYMCDDDKIKAMTQREFEELLSPARKITITPYLLFYARYNLQSTPPKSATASTSSPGPVTSSPQTSWSNESLQSSGHSAHSSGIRM
ncbi:hypothetical protein FF38_14214 [Lucilia cuprina]|uniref:USP domain-containing protein n=1 Tax=Lucilia cuprina TaxID=7375 RepID=A0A0L0BPQ3_LUCCU|nr:hypothetical protein FF38_14214 [Lucilia cuprina]